METLQIATAFILVIFAPMAIAELIKTRKENKKPTVIRHRYDTVYNWFYQQYANECSDGINIPHFMNREIMAKSHAKAVEIAQSGKLHKVYNQIMRNTRCV